MRPASQLSDYSPFCEQNVTELLKDSPAHWASPHSTNTAPSQPTTNLFASFQTTLDPFKA